MIVQKGTYNQFSFSIILPSGTTKIGEDAFEGFTKLFHINLPYGLQEIGESAFANCLSLDLLTIPDSVKKIGRYAFSNCRKMRNVPLPRHLSILSEGAFAMCDTISYVNIPGSVKTIERACFYCCKELHTVIVSEGVEVIEANAFCGCGRLYSITLPSTIRHVSSSAFVGCDDLCEIRVPRGMVNDFRFRGIVPFEKRDLIIDDRVARLNQYTIYRGDKFSLMSVNPNNQGTFYVPKNVKKIDNYAFLSCENITNLVIPEGVEEIDEVAFAGLDQISHFELPRSIKCLHGQTFKGKTVSFPNGNDKYIVKNNHLCEILSDGTLKLLRAYVNPSSKSLMIPNEISCIGESSCSDLAVEQIILPAGLKKICSRAFARCDHLSSLVIPATVQLLEDECFFSLRGLEYIRFESNNPMYMHVGKNIKYTRDWNYEYDELNDFPNYSSCTILVPRGSKLRYMNNPEFVRFKAIEEY